ncbi:hypothetical protein [Yersinia enterocolitica]
MIYYKKIMVGLLLVSLLVLMFPYIKDIEVNKVNWQKIEIVMNVLCPNDTSPSKLNEVSGDDSIKYKIADIGAKNIEVVM